MPDWLVQFTAHVAHVAADGDARDMAAVFLVASLTELGIPFPLLLDSLLLLLGFSIADLWPKVIIVMLVLLAGRELGSNAVYWLSRSLGTPILRALGRRFPSLLVRMDKITRRLGLKAGLTVALARLGTRAPVAASASSVGFRAPLTIVMARMTPGLLTATSVASGILRFRFRYFALGIGIASIVDDLATISVGVVMGYGLRRIVSFPSSHLAVVAVLLDIAVLVILQRLLWRRSAPNPG